MDDRPTISANYIEGGRQSFWQRNRREIAFFALGMVILLASLYIHHFIEPSLAGV